MATATSRFIELSTLLWGLLCPTILIQWLSYPIWRQHSAVLAGSCPSTTSSLSVSHQE
jgi:hypothetical protein